MKRMTEIRFSETNIYEQPFLNPYQMKIVSSYL